MTDQTRIPRKKAHAPSELVQNTLESGGQPLDTSTRAALEPRFGHSFADVRVHTDAHAVDSAEAVQAHAYTSGSDIAFGAGQYAPGTAGGDRLIAHELTHVVQQRGTTGAVQPKALAVSQPGDASEREADTVADQVLAGERVQVQRQAPPVIQRDKDDAGTTAPTVAPTDAGTVPAGVGGVSAGPIPQDLLDFRASGPFPHDAAGLTIVPETGMGGFNAHYDPVRMALSIIVNIAMDFVNGLDIKGNRVVANDPGLTPYADLVNRARGRKRQEMLDKVRERYQWNGQEDSWMETYKASVRGVWNAKHVFQGSRPGWDSQLANVNIVINTTKTVASGTGPGTAASGPQPTHCQARILKTADYNTAVNAEVGAGAADNATDQTLTLGSGQAITTVQKLTNSVFFANGSSALNADAKSELDKFIISFQAPSGGSGTTLDITGHANTVGGGTPAGDAFNQTLSEQRAQSVADYLKTAVVETKTLANATTRIKSEVGTGAVGADESANWRKTDIVAAGGQQQNEAAHEFGHMIGLDDEYASTPQRDAAGNIVTDANGDAVTRGLIGGTGGEVGDPTASNGLAQRMGMGGSVYENNDNVMSLGSTVRPQHYSTFMQALHTLTGMDEWQLKA